MNTSLKSTEFDIPISTDRIREDVFSVLDKYCSELGTPETILVSEELNELICTILEDLDARVKQDPVAICQEFIYSLSRSFRAIFHYRIATKIFYGESNNDLYRFCAIRISEFAVLRFGIEIHPQARIGKRFVIDHGLNTLIGATSEIGDDCTFLNNVLLGSRKITHNLREKRHPTVGNGVQLAGGVRLLGNIVIGDNCKIGPDCVIKEDIPSNQIVELKKEYTIRQRKRV